MAEARGPGGTRELGKVLAALLGRRGLGRSQAALHEACRAWVAAAGDDLAGHTRVRSLRSGVLTVDVDSPPLCHHLASFQKEELLLLVKERVKKAEVAELRFRLGSFAAE